MDLMYTAHLPAGDGPFPTILALHGWGANAHDLLGLAPLLHGGEAIVLCPQGPISFDVGPGMGGYGWFPIGGGAADPGAFERGADAVRAFLDAAAERYPVDRRKIVVLGFSQGGVLAYQLALANPERFAGLAALSSWLPGHVGAAIPASDAHAQLPTLVIHGTQDPMISSERGRDSRDRLAKLEVSLTYREYEMGHEIRPEALRTLVEWLEEKVLTPVLLA